MTRTVRLAIATYALVAIVTFGHAAASQAERNRTVYAICRDDNPENLRLCEVDRAYEVPSTFSGLVSGAIWPLYWSWEAWS